MLIVCLFVLTSSRVVRFCNYFLSYKGRKREFSKKKIILPLPVAHLDIFLKKYILEYGASGIIVSGFDGSGLKLIGRNH